MVLVRLFGAFTLDWELPLRIALGTPARRLASYLFSFPNVAHRRERILDLFWRDADVAQARKALSMALWRIRCPLSHHLKSEIVLRSDPRAIWLELADPNIVDAHRFRAAVTEALSAVAPAAKFEMLDRAVGLHTAPFLEDCDQDWALHKREELQSLHLRALTQLMHENARKKQYEEALDFGRRILASDPTRETVQRAVMLLYVLNSQRAEAIRQFRRCETALRNECDVDPMPETSILFTLIRSGEVFQNLAQLVDRELSFFSQSSAPLTPFGASSHRR